MTKAARGSDIETIERTSRDAKRMDMRPWKDFGVRSVVVTALAALVGAGCVGSEPASAGDEPDGRSSLRSWDFSAPPEVATGIVATGSGVVSAQPDSLRVTVGVEAQAPTVEDVQKQANNRMQRVLASLRALAIPGLQMQTNILSVRPVRAETPEGVEKAEIIGYSASNRVAVAIRRVPVDALAGHASAILNAALTTGANVMGDLELFLDDPSSVRVQALEIAVRDARHNGEIMARAAGLTVTGVALVSADAESSPVSVRRYKRASSSRTPVEIGEVVVSSSVTMRLDCR